MKNWLCLLLLCPMLIHCGPKQDAVERYIEDGVEVVVNHIEPYQISGWRSLSLELLLSIDTEQEEILELGIPDILGFDVNSRGEIFLVRG